MDATDNHCDKEITAFVIAFRATFSVTSICRVLGVLVASLRSLLSRPVPARVFVDEQIMKLIVELFEDNYSDSPTLENVAHYGHDQVVEEMFGDGT